MAERDQQIGDKYLNGISVSTIATEYEMTKANVYKILKRRGLVSRKKSRRDNQILNNLMSGKTQTEITRSMGICKNTIKSVWNKRDNG